MTLSDEEWQEKAEQGLKELIEGATVTKEQIDKDGCIPTESLSHRSYQPYQRRARYHHCQQRQPSSCHGNPGPDV